MSTDEKGPRSRRRGTGPGPRRAVAEAERIIWRDRHDRPGAYTVKTPPAQRGPRPLGSLAASAARITTRTISRSRGVVSPEEWQSEAWDMFDTVGEEHFLAGTIAAYMGQARLFVGRRPDDPTEDLEPLDSGAPVDLLDRLRDMSGSTSQMLTRFGISLFAVGDCYLVGVPSDSYVSEQGDPGMIWGDDDDYYRVPLESVVWSARSIDEVRVDQNMVTIDDGSPSPDGVGTGRSYDPRDVYLVRVWRPHPRKSWWADSPTKASLSVLRELVGLSQHVSAQIDSRLAGAGLMTFPAEALDEAKAQMNPVGGVNSERDDSEDNPVVAALMTAMLDPLKNRDSAASVVPLVVTMPHEYIDGVRKIDFSTPLDDASVGLREEAIRRLALGQDCPPELLLGTDSMNHWGAWLVKEDTVTTHLEPPLALVCDALTTGFLWPLLVQNGMSEEDATQYVVWFDVDHLILRPNRSQDAKDLHAAGVLSDKALRDASGFDESDAPDTSGRLDPAVRVALDLVAKAPSLAQDPGLGALVEQVRSIMAAAPASESPLEAVGGRPSDAPADGGPPDTPQPGEGAIPATDGGSPNV